MDTNHYTNSLEDFAKVDNILASAQMEIGESSNLGQLCLTYTYNFDDELYQNNACVLAVLAQAAIDQSKRRYNINIGEEIRRIKKEIKVAENGYPEFWELILKDRTGEKKINWCRNHIKTNNPTKLKKWGCDIDEERDVLVCPMNTVCNKKFPFVARQTATIPTADFIIPYTDVKIGYIAKKVEKLIEKYSIELINYNISANDEDEYLILREDFDQLIKDIRSVSISSKYKFIFTWLINRGFGINPKTKENMKSKIDKNRSLLLKVLYDVNPEALLSCFKKSEEMGIKSTYELTDDKGDD